MNIQFPENLGRIKEMLVVKDPASVILSAHVCFLVHEGTHFFALKARRGRFNNNASQYPLIKKRKVRNA